MTEAAWHKVDERLARVLPGRAEVVTLSQSGIFAINRRPIEADQVKPEVTWISLDAYVDELAPTMAERIMNGGASRWVQVANAGMDRAMFKDMMAGGIRISKSDAQAAPISEYVMTHALSLLVPIDEQRAAQAERLWQRTYYRDVAATRWIVVGYGAIGREISRRAKAFGVHLTVVRRAAKPDSDVDEVITQAELHKHLPYADVVVLACALNNETQDLCDEAFVGSLKAGCILINVGRGALIDDEALRAGLDRDQPARAVLDVFREEPLPSDSWFWAHPKVRVTAHTSSTGQGTSSRGEILFLENLRRYLSEEPLVNEAEPREVGLS